MEGKHEVKEEKEGKEASNTEVIDATTGERIGELEARPPLVPQPIEHPEEQVPPAVFAEEETTLIQDFPLNEKHDNTGLSDQLFKSGDPRIPDTIPTHDWLLNWRSALLLSQTDNDQWNPVVGATPPPWLLKDGWVPASTQHVSEKNAAETASAAIDPNSLQRLIAGRNLAITDLIEKKDAQLNYPNPFIDKEVHRLESAYQPMYYQEQLKKQGQYRPELLSLGDVGSRYTLE